MKKKKKIKIEEEVKQEEEKETSLEERDFSDLIKQIEDEYQLSYWFMKPKWEEWALRLKLFNNQKRDKSAVGDPLLFTTFQTVLASLYEDKLAVVFDYRENGDEEVAENLTDMAEFDYDEMEKDILDYEWIWDTAFFGRGLVCEMEFNREKKCPLPEVWDPMTVLRDPNAVSINGDRKGRGGSRFIGRENRMTKWEMKEAGVYFNLDKIKKQKGGNINSLYDRNKQLRAEAQGLTKTTFDAGLSGDNETTLIYDWITKYNGKWVFVSLANDRKTVVRFSEIKGNKIPLVDRALYPISHDWDGVSIPDLTEDKQRARAKLLNLGIKIVETGLNSAYVFDTTKITNKADLVNLEQNKFIGVSGNPNGVLAEVPRSHINQDVAFVMNTLDTAAQKSNATPDIQQGNVSNERRTATELNIIDQKVDTRYSLSAKIFGWSEKRFWQQWYFLYKNYFKEGIDEKKVRISGVLGAKIRPLRRENIIAQVDPDVKIESRVVSDAKRFNQLQLFRGFVQNLSLDPNANLRFALKHMAKLTGLKRDMINQVLPPTIDEMIAEDENNRLEANKIVEVLATDDHMTHIQIHNKLSDTPAKFAHIEAHKRAMILQKMKPEIFPSPTNNMNPTNGEGVGDKNLPPMERENRKIPIM